MKQKSYLFLAVIMLTGIFGMQTLHATPNKPASQTGSPFFSKSGWSVNLHTIQVFERYSRMLEKAKPLAVSTTKSLLTNSSLSNYRPNGYSLIIPMLEVYRNGTSDYYYMDNVSNGATVYFTIPDIANVNYATLYQLGENFHNWEDGVLESDGGNTQLYGSVPSGINKMEFYNGTQPTYNFVNGVAITVY